MYLTNNTSSSGGFEGSGGGDRFSRSAEGV
jgi:hypothetical protein